MGRRLSHAISPSGVELGVLGAPSSLTDLAAVLDALDNPDLGGTGIAVLFNNVLADNIANTLSFDFVATRALSVPIKLADARIPLTLNTYGWGCS